MRTVFAIAILLAVAMYGVAQWTLPRPPRDGTVRLRWASDTNPARTLQCNTFASMYPGYSVSVDPGDSVKLMVQCATGSGPDILDCNEAGMLTLVQAGILMDVTDYAKRMGFGTDKTYPALEGALTVQGRQYRYPCNVWANCIIYNKAIFDDHGVAYPKDDWTYEEFIATGKALRERPSRSGMKHIPLANWYNEWLFPDTLLGHGGRFFRADGLRSDMDSPQAIAAMKYYHDLMHVHHIMPDAAEMAATGSAGGWGTGGLQWFASEKAAMISIGRWYLVLAPNYPNLQGKLAAARMPRRPGHRSTGITDSRAAAINVRSPNALHATKFLQYLAGREYGQLIVKDGDSLPPNPVLARTGEDLKNDFMPDAHFHQLFIDAVRDARPMDWSLFMDPLQSRRWMREAVERVENRVQTPEEACRSLAAEINQQIRRNLERQKNLQELYQQITGRAYTTDWWR